MPTPGDHFSRKQILGFYQHDPSDLYWVVFRGRQILAMCLRSDFNPHLQRVPAEVWIGDDSPTKEWGDILANDTARVPIYMKQTGENEFVYLGEFDVLNRTATDAELNAARETILHQHQRGISRIVFLKKT